MSLAVAWSSLAKAQLADLYDYISEDGPIAADEEIELIVECTAKLADFLGMGRPGRRSGTRELVVPRTSYIVAYRIKLATIEILAVMHGAQRWSRRFR